MHFSKVAFAIINLVLAACYLQAGPTAAAPTTKTGRVVRVNLAKEPALRTQQLAAARARIASLGRASGSSKASISTFSTGVGECDTSEACGGGDDLIQIWDTVYLDGVSGPDAVLERVFIYGRSSCSVEVSGSWGSGMASCDDVRALGSDPDIVGFEGAIGRPGLMVEQAFALLDSLTPVLPKCAPTSKSSSINTPAKDKEMSYIAAIDAIHRAFADNWDAMSVPSRVDVKYPNGDVVRYLVTGKDDAAKTTTIEPVNGNGRPDPKDNACK